MSRNLAAELKETLGGEPTFLFLDSTRLDFLTGTFEMASASLVSGPTGIAKHGLFVVHKSKHDRMEALVNELKAMGIQAEKLIVVAHGRVSDYDVEVLKNYREDCILIEATKFMRLPRLVLRVDKKYENTPWGVCLEHGDNYLLNLTWAMDEVKGGYSKTSTSHVQAT